jgi:hypothetical protein
MDAIDGKMEEGNVVAPPLILPIATACTIETLVKDINLPTVTVFILLR